MSQLSVETVSNFLVEVTPSKMLGLFVHTHNTLSPLPLPMPKILDETLIVFPAGIAIYICNESEERSTLPAQSVSLQALLLHKLPVTLHYMICLLCMVVWSY